MALYLALWLTKSKKFQLSAFIYIIAVIIINKNNYIEVLLKPPHIYKDLMPTNLNSIYLVKTYVHWHPDVNSRIDQRIKILTKAQFKWRFYLFHLSPFDWSLHLSINDALIGSILKMVKVIRKSCFYLHLLLSFAAYRCLGNLLLTQLCCLIF